MIFNYLITSFRNLIKRWPYSLVNLLGLTLGLTCFIFLFSFILYLESMDEFQPHKDEVHTVIFETYNGSNLEEKLTDIMPALGNTIKKEITGIKHVTHRKWQFGSNVKNEHLASEESGVIYADNDYFKMFKVDLLRGDPETALIEPFSVVITEETAQRYFPSEDPIGKQVEIGNEYGNEKYTVTAIAKNFPQNTNFGFDFLCSFNSPFNNAKWFVESWTWYVFKTYISFEDGYTKEDILAQFPEYIKKYKTEKIAPDRTWKFRLEPISVRHLRSYNPDGPENAPERFHWVIKILALLIVIISWVNYINLSTAGASERAKEVGIRKAIGATKTQIIKQFFIEATLLNVTAALLATGLSFILFNTFAQFLETGFTIDVLYYKKVWFYLAGITLIGILASGFYPSIVLGSFKSIDVLKTKSVTSPASARVRKILVGVQFFISMAFISTTAILVHQSEYERSLPLGIDYSNKVKVRKPKFTKKENYVKKYPSFIEQLKELPEVKSVTASYRAAPFSGLYSSAWLISKGEKSKAIYDLEGIDENYIPDYKIKILFGRNFKPKGVGSEDEVILSQRTAERLGFEKPEEALGTKIGIAGFKERHFNVVGIVDNYKYRATNSKLRGNMMIQNTGYMDAPGVFSITINSMEQLSTVQEKIEEVYNHNFPNDVFSSQIVNDIYKRALKRQSSTKNLSLVFSGLAIILAFVGVFGLASFIALLKTKEIGLRKLFGAGNKNITWVLSKEFVIILCVITVLVVPLLVYLMRMYLSDFSSRITLSIWHFAIGFFGIGVINCTNSCSRTF